MKRITFLIDDPVKERFDVAHVVADKGYDAEYVHVDIHDRLNMEAFIPVRKIEPASMETSRVKTSGFNRGRMKFFFDKETYNRRSQVETVVPWSSVR